MPPLVFQKTVTLPPPSDDDRRAQDQRLRDSLGLPDLDLPLPLLRTGHERLRQGGDCACIIAAGRRPLLVALDRRRSDSVALDLGTTNLVALLYDNIAERDVLARSLENPQVAFGSDILTRLHYAMSGNGQDVYRVLPVGTPPNALVYGTGALTIPQMAKAGWWLNVFFIALISLTCYFFAGRLFGAP